MSTFSFDPSPPPSSQTAYVPPPIAPSTTISSTTLASTTSSSDNPYSILIIFGGIAIIFLSIAGFFLWVDVKIFHLIFG